MEREKQNGFAQRSLTTKPSDVVDAVCMLSSLRFTLTTDENNILQRANIMWKCYLHSGRFASQVLAMGQDKQEKILKLYAMCINHRRYDMVGQIAHVNKFHYRSFLVAICIGGDVASDGFFIRDMRAGVADTTAFRMFAKKSNVKITLPTVPRETIFTIFDAGYAIKDALYAFLSVGMLQVEDQQQLKHDFELAKIDAAMLDNQWNAQQADDLIEFLDRSYESICSYTEETNSTPPRLYDISADVLHYAVVGPQANRLRRACVYWALGLSCVMAHRLLNEERYCMGEQENEHACISVEDVEDIYKLCKDPVNRFRACDVLGKTMLANPDLKNAICYEQYSLRCEMFFSVSQRL